MHILYLFNKNILLRAFCQAVFIVLWLFSGQTTVFAQTGGVKGKVNSYDGKSVSFASVILKNTPWGTTTSEDGSFQLSKVKAGDYTLVISFIGAKSQEKPIQIIENQVLEVDFVLEESSQQLNEIQITGSQTKFDEPVDVSKAGIKPLDLPQATFTINRQVLERQQVLRMSDVLMNTSGVYVMGTTGGSQEEIAGRGFAFSSSNTFKNGTRFNNGVMPEMSSLERVEVLKGSTAILFGNVAAGGILNLITKKPKFQQGGEISMRVGSYDFYKPSLDIYGAINNSQKLAYRVNTSYEKAKSFRDEVASERFYINPSFLIKLNKKAEILLEGDYLKDNRTSDFGIGAVNYTIPDLPRNRFIGAKWSSYQIEQKSVSATFTYQIKNNWQLRTVAAHQNYQNTLFGTARPNASSQFIKADGKWVRGLQRNEVREKYYVAQIDLTGQFETGSVKHQVLFGADADRYDTETTAFNNLAKYDSINVFNLELYPQRQDIPSLTKNTLTTAPIRRFGVYAQDLVSINDYVKVLAGLRYSYQQTSSNILTYSTRLNQENSNFDEAFSPRLGLVIQPTKMMSIFGSYSNSFTLNTGTDVNGSALPPSIINQYEAGMKNELLKGVLSANLTFYRIINSNLAQTSLANNTRRELAGEVTSQGIEVDIISKPIKGFSFIAGYSFNNTRYTKSNTYIEGSKLRYNPNHTANLSVYYAFKESSKLKGLNIGLMNYYMGERFAGRSTRIQVDNDTYRLIPLAAYLQMDASVGYSLEKVSFRVKISNLLNQLSYNVHDDNSINPIAPRMFSTTVSFKL